jgi:hypothetical protein
MLRVSVYHLLELLNSLCILENAKVADAQEVVTF